MVNHKKLHFSDGQNLLVTDRIGHTQMLREGVESDRSLHPSTLPRMVQQSVPPPSENC